MKIVIITDGNNKLGMGHVYQAMTLSYFLKSATDGSVEIKFITKSDNKVVELLKTTQCHVSYYDNDQLIFNSLKENTPDIVVFDKLDVSPDLASKIKNKLGLKLVIFTNLTEANKYADITVMAGMGSEFKNIYTKDSETGQVQFWGPKYWLLRKEFYSYKRKRKHHKSSLDKILLIFGGSDQANLSSEVLQKLLYIEEIKEITVILGASFENHVEFEEIVNSNINSGILIHVLKNVSNVAEIMHNKDLVFVSPGLSFFEALLVGSPVLCFHQNDFQKDAWNGLIPTLDKADLEKLSIILSNRDFIFPDTSYILSMEIGLGKNEIINQILALASTGMDINRVNNN